MSPIIARALTHVRLSLMANREQNRTTLICSRGPWCLSHYIRIIFASCSSLLLLNGRLAACRLASNRLLSVLLAAAQQFQVTSAASQSLLGHGLETSGVFLVDGVGADEDGLLGLDDFVAGLDALRPTRRIVSTLLRFAISGGRIVSYGLAGIFFSVLAFLSCT